MERNSTIYQALKATAELAPTHPALVYRGHEYSYQDVLLSVNRIAYFLNKMGYKKDDVITVMLPNVPMSVYLLYAINQIGAVANLIHPLMGIAQLKGIMEKTKSKILFALDQRVNDLKEIKEVGITIYSVSPVYDQNPITRAIYYYTNQRNVHEPFVHKLVGEETLTTYDTDYKKDSFYLHSGGTTGEPKTIALSSFSLNSLVISGLEILDVKEAYGQYMLAVLPMFHGFGLCMGIHACLANGGTDVLMPKFSTDEVIKYLDRGQLTILIGVPIIYEALLRNKHFHGELLERVDNAFVGGDTVSDSLVYRFNQRLKEAGARARLYSGYGLTETVTVCTVNTHLGNRLGSVGRAIPFMKVKAFDGNNELPADIRGELCATGDCLMNGYRFETNIADSFFTDKNGVRWLRTGDYGKVDREGYVYFMQRLKRIAKVNGVNIFPSEIENAISELPYIYMCYAKRIDDEKHGSMLNLYVVLDKSATKENYDEELKTLIRDKFSVYALPKKIIYKDALPKTLIGKVDEKQLTDD